MNFFSKIEGIKLIGIYHCVLWQLVLQMMNEPILFLSIQRNNCVGLKYQKQG